MTDTFQDDRIARDLVVALDALPVPEEPTGFGAVARPSLVRDVRVLLAAALLLVLVATVTSPQFQQAAAELRRYIERIVLGPAWVGYYEDHSTVGTACSPERAGCTPNGPPPLRILVTRGDGNSRPTTPEIPDALGAGPWSPDGEHIVLAGRSRLYIGDQFGRVTPIADVDPRYIPAMAGWTGNDKVWVIVAPLPFGDDPTLTRSIETVDIKSGAVELRPLDPDMPLGRATDDGRWIPLPMALSPSTLATCGLIGSLYDVPGKRTVDIVDSSGRSATAFGFLRERIVIGQCDRSARTLELYVGAPDARPRLIATVPLGDVRRPVVIVDAVRDEIVVIASGPEAPQSAFVFDPSGRLLRRMPLPQLALAGTIEYAGLSRDGRFMNVDVTGLVRQPVVMYVTRSAVIDLRTGEVTYLCERDCDYLGLR